MGVKWEIRGKGKKSQPPTRQTRVWGTRILPRRSVRATRPATRPLTHLV